MCKIACSSLQIVFFSRENKPQTDQDLLLCKSKKPARVGEAW